MLPYILIAVAAVIVLLVVIVASRPADFRIARSANMAAPAPVVFAQVNDFHHWEAWSPWAKLDPNCKVIYEGPPAGVGAIMKWSGDKKVGEGMMTILETRAGELIRIKLQFLRPFKATHTAEFTFKSLTPDQTNVNWAMTGRNNFMAKAFHMTMDCDKMVGTDFEKGLASMKSIVESEPARVAVGSV